MGSDMQGVDSLPYTLGERLDIVDKVREGGILLNTILVQKKTLEVANFLGHLYDDQLRPFVYFLLTGDVPHGPSDLHLCVVTTRLMELKKMVQDMVNGDYDEAEYERVRLRQAADQSLFMINVQEANTPFETESVKTIAKTYGVLKREVRRRLDDGTLGLYIRTLEEQRNKQTA